MLPTTQAKSVHRKSISRYALTVSLVLLGTGTHSLAEAAGEASSVGISTSQQQASYSVGYEFGRYLAELKRQGPGVEMETVLQGVLDAMTGARQQLTSKEMDAVLSELKHMPVITGKQTLTNTVRRKQPARTGRNMDDYANLNAKRDGVVVLPSGVQYEVLQAGSGKVSQITDAVMVNYEGTLTNGVVFDSTYKEGKPAHLQLDDVAVPGLKEALLLMKAGDKWRVVIPPAMGFANSGNNLLRRRDLIYEIELLAIDADQRNTTAKPNPVE